MLCGACPTAPGRPGQGTRRRPTPPPTSLPSSTQRPSASAPTLSCAPSSRTRILPTTAYIGGPAEVAYFAQSAVLYEPHPLAASRPSCRAFPRRSSNPPSAPSWRSTRSPCPTQCSSTEDLAQRLGARAMPIEAKRRLADRRQRARRSPDAAQDYLGTLDASLGKSAEVSASKMRYQMDRLAPSGCDLRAEQRGQPEEARRGDDAASLSRGPSAGAGDRRRLVSCGE